MRHQGVVVQQIGNCCKDPAEPPVLGDASILEGRKAGGKSIQMTSNLTFSSPRTFKLWEYQVSHSQLLIRSPNAPATQQSTECFTNIDLLFASVDYCALPHLIRGIEISAPTAAELEHLEVVLGDRPDFGDVFVLVSSGQRFPVVAGRLAITENDWDIFESPIEFRSQFRGLELSGPPLPRPEGK